MTFAEFQIKNDALLAKEDEMLKHARRLEDKASELLRQARAWRDAAADIAVRRANIWKE